MNEDLDYNFNEGSGVLGGSNKSDPDIGNVSILKQILKELDQIKLGLDKRSTLNLQDKVFTIEQQVANGTWAVNLISQLELIIKEKLKELGNGR